MHTRFCPTLSGKLHLGHAMLLLVNYHEATSTGGRMVVRADDGQKLWLEQYGREKIEEFRRSIQEDVEWLGLDGCLFTSEAELYDRVDSEYGVRKWEPADGGLSGIFPVPEVLSGTYFPAASHLTGATVAMDYWDGIDLVIRGIDLISQDGAYVLLCQTWGLPIPRRVYIPRLTAAVNTWGMGASSQELRVGGWVSKTEGNFRLCDLRQKFGAEYLIDKLAQSCLRDPSGPWSIKNILPNPVVRATEWQ